MTAWPMVLCLNGASRHCLVDFQRRYDPDYTLPVPLFPAIRHYAAPAEEPDPEMVKVMTATPAQVKHGALDR